MAPEIPVHGEPNNYWNGLNILGNMVETRGWYGQVKGSIPQEITAKWLGETRAPWQAVAVIRGFSRREIVKNQRFPGDIGEGLKQILPDWNSIKAVGEVESGNPTSETYEHWGEVWQFPLTLEKGGEIYLQVSDAWGVSWSLSADHPLAEEQRDLTEPWGRDMRTTATNTPHDLWGQKQVYILPEELGGITRKWINTRELIEDIRQLMVDLSQEQTEQMRVKIFRSGGTSAGSHRHFIDGTIIDSVEANLNFSAGVRLNLGVNRGLRGRREFRLARVIPWRGEEEEVVREDLVDRAKELQGIIRSFYSLS